MSTSIDSRNSVCVLQEDPEKARVTINNWIANKTENLIQDTLPPGVLDSNTILVLVNTIYFKVPVALLYSGWWFLCSGQGSLHLVACGLTCFDF